MKPKIAYLSSEFALSDDLPIYAGGLGILAADVLRQAADDNFPLVGVTLFYREGFFKQRIDAAGNQEHFYEKIDPAAAGLVDLDHLLEIPFPARNASPARHAGASHAGWRSDAGGPDRKIYLKIWQKNVQSTNQPINQSTLYLLDADVPENSSPDRTIAYRLYERVWAPHLDDDLLLGIGGVRLFRKLGIPVKVWHINDDHASFNILERIREYLGQGLSLSAAREKVKAETIFTTHTPVGGAESKFSKEEITPILAALFGPLKVDPLKVYELGKREWEGQEVFSLTVFAMRHARAVNAVSKKHFEVAKELWSFIGDLPLTYITNGVYAPGWTAPELHGIHPKGVTEAKQRAKARVAPRLGFDPNALVLSWARRFTEYKQPLLLLSDLNRLAKILANPQRPAYLLLSGKAHPEDPVGRDFVKTVIAATHDPRLNRRLIYLPNYNLEIARDLLSASDVWLNTPVPGWEASGTSGMKAVFNAALNASTADGWWLEGFNGKNGWVIDPPDANSLYHLLEEEIIPTYFQDQEKWAAMVKEALATCGTRFNTKRMLEEYTKLYR